MLTKNGDPIICKYTDTDVLLAILDLSVDQRDVLNKNFTASTLYKILNDGERFRDIITSLNNAVKKYQACIDGIFALRESVKNQHSTRPLIEAMVAVYHNHLSEAEKEEIYMRTIGQSAKESFDGK